MKPKTIQEVLEWFIGYPLEDDVTGNMETALAQIQQLLEECAPEKLYKQDEAWRVAVNDTIDQYKSNIRGKLHG